MNLIDFAGHYRIAMLELKIAKPCGEAWGEMSGDARTRHCERCRKNVFNIAELSEREVEELIRRTEGKFCARIYQRADGTVLTRDCPKGVAGVRRRVALTLTTVAGALLYATTFASTARREPRTLEQIKQDARKVEPIRKIIDAIDPPAPIVTRLPVMGAAAYPTISRASVRGSSKTGP